MSVFARPGTPISRAWLRQKIAMSSWSSTFSWPMMTLPISFFNFWWAARSFSIISTSFSTMLALMCGFGVIGDRGRAGRKGVWRVPGII